MKKINRLFWINALLVFMYAAGYFRYVKVFCTAQGFFFSNGILAVYTAGHIIILLLPALVNYFYLIDRFENRGYGWKFYGLQALLLTAVLWLHALQDAAFLRPYQVPWLFSEAHIYGRMFVNLCFMLLFGFQKVIINNIRKREQEHQLKTAQLEASLKFLRTQISPHFLFNTLNNIYSYAVQKKEETPGLILKLSGILRYLSDAGNLQNLVPVEKELDAVNQLAGLYLVNSRWQPKVSWQVTDSRMNGMPLMTEPQSLLTLAENAFKHCQLDEPDAFITARITINNAGLTAIISNSMAAKPPAEKPGTGLDNLRRRLDITYGGRHRLDVETGNQCFTVHLFLPS